jgi:hypothetical protein
MELFTTSNQNVWADENPHSFQEIRIPQEFAISVRAVPSQVRMKYCFNSQGGASCLQFLSEQATANTKRPTIGNMADSVATAWWSSCPYSGNAMRYRDSLSG